MLLHHTRFGDHRPLDIQEKNRFCVITHNIHMITIGSLAFSGYVMIKLRWRIHHFKIKLCLCLIITILSTILSFEYVESGPPREILNRFKFSLSLTAFCYLTLTWINHYDLLEREPQLFFFRFILFLFRSLMNRCREKCSRSAIAAFLFVILPVVLIIIALTDSTINFFCEFIEFNNSKKCD
jgi:hypothetical protein